MTSTKVTDQNLTSKHRIGKPVDWAVADPFDLAGLLKLYLVSLPDSLVPYEVYNALKKVDTSEEEDAIRVYRKTLHRLPHEAIVWRH